jgi:hypothetical protein
MLNTSHNLYYVKLQRRTRREATNGAACEANSAANC